MPTVRSRYSSVSLPEALLKRVKTFVTKHPEKGYMNVTDFIRHAVIEKLDEYKA